MSTRQDFDTVDVLRLDVEVEPEGLKNLVRNPSGETGAWGWVTPVAGATLNAVPGALQYVNTPNVASYFYTENLPVVAGQYLAASWSLLVGTSPVNYYRARFEWLDASGVLISSSAQTGYLAGNVAAAGNFLPVVVPAGAVSARFRFDLYTGTTGNPPIAATSLTVSKVTVAAAASAADLVSVRHNLIPNPALDTTTGWTASGPAFERRNLIPNPSFETNATGWVRGSGTDTYQYGRVSASSEALSGASGKYVLRVNPLNSSARSYVNGPKVPVTAGLPYAMQLRLWSLGQDGTAGFKYRFYNATGNTILDADQTRTGAPASGAKVSAVVTAPAGATQLQLLPFTTGKSSVSGTWFLDSVMVEQSDTVSAYFDGDTADTDTWAYSWAGTANASQSIASRPAITLGTATTTPAPPSSPSALSAAVAAGAITTELTVATQALPITAGRDYRFSIQALAGAGATGRTATARLRWLKGSTVVETSQVSVVLSDAWQELALPTETAPVTATSVRVEVGLPMDGTAATLYLDSAILEPYQEDLSVGWFDGDTPPPGDNWTTSWDGEANNSPSTAVNSNLPYIPPIEWLNIVPESQSLNLDRDELNPGTLSGTVLSTSLDPANADTIRPGHAVRLTTLSDGVWEPIFTGTLTNAIVTYNYLAPDEKQASIALTATDSVATLSGTTRSQSVGKISDLPFVLEGVGVPWCVNGSGNQVPTAQVVATNDSASALDQVALTRDSNLGYAWVDQKGILQAWDADLIPTDAPILLDETVYNPDINIDFDTERCVNSVTVTRQWQALDGTTQETTYGPYVNADSIRTWGAHSQDFTVAGIAESDVPAYAQAILDANSIPQRRVNSLVIPVTSATIDKTLIDLYALVQVVNQRADLDLLLRVVSVSHSIQADKWLMTVGFASDGSVAPAAIQPPVTSQALPEPYLSMKKDSTDQAITASTWTEVAGWTITTIQGLDQAFSHVTIQQAGLYLVQFTVGWLPGISRCLAAITLNDTSGSGAGLLARTDEETKASARIATSITIPVQCVPGDIIRGLVWTNAARSLEGGTSTMSVVRIK